MAHPYPPTPITDQWIPWWKEILEKMLSGVSAIAFGTNNTDCNEIPHPGICTDFKTYQGDKSMSLSFIHDGSLVIISSEDQIKIDGRHGTNIAIKLAWPSEWAISRYFFVQTDPYKSRDSWVRCEFVRLVEKCQGRQQTRPSAEELWAEAEASVTKSEKWRTERGVEMPYNAEDDYLVRT